MNAPLAYMVTGEGIFEDAIFFKRVYAEACFVERKNNPKYFGWLIPLVPEVIEKGSWSVQEWKDDRVVVMSEDFTHDVALEISGDWGTKEEKIAHAQFIADKLNRE